MDNRTLELTYYDFYQGLLTPLILLLGLILCLLFVPKKPKELVFVSLLYIWHTLFSFLYWYLSINGVADALGYFKKTFRIPFNIDLSPGTRFVEFVTYIIRVSFDSNYLNTTLVFNIIGSLGLVFIYLSLREYLKVISKYWSLFLFIPSISYWSSAIGKDSLVFFAISIFIYAITTSKKRIPLVFLSLAILFMIRPHIALAVQLSFIIYFIIQSKSHIILKVVSLPFIIGASAIALSFVQEYVGVDEVSVEGVEDYFDGRKHLNMDGGSSIDTSSMILPVKMFSYIFRPFPFEAHSLIAFIASIENSIIFLSFVYIAYKARGSFNTIFKNENLWLFLYTITTWIMLSYGLKNLGIAARQKWMFMPVIIYLLLSTYLNYKRERFYSNL